MGEIVTLADIDGSGPAPAGESGLRGYLARPSEPNGRAVVVIQEWWGIVPHIESVCDRLAAEGFAALAPDLYHGESTTEPDEAAKLMMALNAPEAAREIDAAADALLSLDEVTSTSVNVLGFCMGGGLALVYSCVAGDKVAVVAPFYGLIPWPDAAPDYSALRAVVRGHYAEKDDFFPPQAAEDLAEELHRLGKDAELVVHPGVDHAFFNDDRPEVYDEATADAAWRATVAAFAAT